jgi:hypothetical protein
MDEADKEKVLQRLVGTSFRLWRHQAADDQDLTKCIISYII